MQIFRIVLFILSAAAVQGMPYFILTSTRSKCLSVIAPQGQTISISYKAPDMQIMEGDEEEEGSSVIDADPSDGADADWNRRMKEKLERMKQKKMRDMSITVTQKSGLAGSYQRERRNSDDKSGGQGRVREELKQREGTIEFRTGEDDGTVDICVQSITANRNSPSRVMLNVSMLMSEEDMEDEASIIDEDGGDALEHSELKVQMTRLERDLQTLNNRVRATLNNAEFNKDQEAEFHARSIRIGAAALYWPIIQIIVIIVTGFTQANHIVKYMKAHHIGP